jgi:hypothetical protein
MEYTWSENAENAEISDTRLELRKECNYREYLQFKWPSSETLYTKKVKVLFLKKSGTYRVLFCVPLQLTYPSDQPSTKEYIISGHIYLCLGSIFGESTSLKITVVKAMWKCRVWSERFLCGWTIDLTREKDSITMIELRRH